MEGVLERAWNHPPLDKCLELVEDSTERSRRGVTERCARGFLLLRLTECTKSVRVMSHGGEQMRGPRGGGVPAPRPGRGVSMSGVTFARASSVNSLTLSADVSLDRSAGRVGAAVVPVVPTSAQTDVLRQQVLAAN